MTYPLRRKQTFRDCIAKWRHFVSVINLIQSVSTGKMKERAKVSKACLNILPYEYSSLLSETNVNLLRQIGTIIPSTTPFGTASADNLARANRKRTLVDELVDDAEAKHYAKKKFEELQKVRGANGRGTWARKQALRRRKW